MIFDYTANGFREWKCGDAEIHGWYLRNEQGREVWAARLVMRGQIVVQLDQCAFWMRSGDDLGSHLVDMLVSQAEYASRAWGELYFQPAPWSVGVLNEIGDYEAAHPPGWSDYDHEEAVRRLLEFPAANSYFLANLDDWLAGVLDDDPSHPDAAQETHYITTEVAA